MRYDTTRPSACSVTACAGHLSWCMPWHGSNAAVGHATLGAEHGTLIDIWHASADAQQQPLARLRRKGQYILQSSIGRPVAIRDIKDAFRMQAVMLKLRVYRSMRGSLEP